MTLLGVFSFPMTHLPVGGANAGPTTFLIITELTVRLLLSENFTDGVQPLFVEFHIFLSVVAIRSGADGHVFPLLLLESSLKLGNAGEQMQFDGRKIVARATRGDFFEITAKWAFGWIMLH